VQVSCGQLAHLLETIMRTPRLGATTSGFRQGRPGSNQNCLPSIAAAPQSIGALVRDAEDATGGAERLRAQIFKTQELSRRRRMELEQEVSEAVRCDAERLASERDGLETQLAENMRQLHTLEVAGMDHNHVTRERKKHARAVTAQLKKLIEVDANDEDAASIHSQGMKTLKDVHQQLEVVKQGIEGDLQQRYFQKERTEAEIADRRKALAINEGLLRARFLHQSERQPDFDEMPSTTDVSLVMQGMRPAGAMIAAS